jgi:glycosyltransferase involved in cell wall biosynthesis
MKIFFAQADFGGCGFYRILQPAAFMKFMRHHEVKVGFKFALPELMEYDLIVFQRQVAPLVIQAIKKLHEHKKKVIYDIDDNMWAIPAENTATSFWTAEKISMAEAIIKECDAVTTSTDPLAEVLRKYNSKVFVVPNYIPDTKPLDKFDSIIRIGWSGSISHVVDFNEDIIRALRDIKKKYKGRVELVFCGWIPEGLVGHVTYHDPVLPIHYLDFLNNLRLHIGIIPCANIPFNDSKSNLKFLEYSITRTASIASAIHPYRNTIRDDTGILIHNGTYEEWSGAIELLVENTELRNRMADTSFNFVRQNYLIQNKIEDIDALYQTILKL